MASSANDWLGMAVALSLCGGLSIAGAWQCIKNLKRAYFVRDTPTSKIRSAAQGFIELYGVIKAPEAQQLAPLSGTPCVWWCYSIEQGVRDNSKAVKWRIVEQGTSDARFFLDDGTGQCLIEPRGAQVRAMTHKRWQGSERHPRQLQAPSLWRSLLGMGYQYRYTEERLHEGEPLYVMGQFFSSGGGSAAFDAEKERGAVISQWKKDFPALLKQFDQDGNGVLDEREWQAVQQAAAREAYRRYREQSALPAQDRLTRPEQDQPFLLSSYGEDELLRRFYWQAALGALLCLGGALAVLTVATAS